MTILELIYDSASTAVALAEHRLVGKSFLVAELRSIINLLDGRISESFKAEVRHRAQAAVDSAKTRK